MSLRDQLQDTLGAAYTITRELGGGGMSRVFVARDEALGRVVVVKVLPPDMLAGVSTERFDREVRLAARLQHAHIVPVLHAGEMDGVPYYTMPFVDGASLRDRLAREGALPIDEVVSVLRDVARALAYAHERGVVHRDIKPDNVLVAGGSAMVTDFGIAKAISAARTGAEGDTLTQVGVSIGTPAYMAPEQAAADPAADHRADIYSFGCLAYEMLAGRPPFTAKSPQQLLAAQMAERPRLVTDLRPDVPVPLAQLVMKCLAKDADHRPQRAVELVRLLDTVMSGGAHDAMPAILASGHGMLTRALALYVVAFVIVAVVAKAAIVVVGLPDWVFPGAVIVMALGLPVILLTAYVHQTTRTLIGATPTYPPGGTKSFASGTLAQLAMKASPHVTWRRSALGGAAAIAAFVLLIGGYMSLRALGIGPAGSLLASGKLAENERVLVADLSSPARDSTLGPVVTEAFRTALGQSQSISIEDPVTVREVLQRMQRDPKSHVDIVLAREIAIRDGIKAIIDGSVIGVGGRYVIAIRLVSAQSGEPLASFRESADNESEVLPAVDRLAKKVRAKIGESLRTVQSAAPLEQVTTSSLEALRKYAQGMRLTSEGELTQGIALLEEAVALDTGFAMAYRRLAAMYNNRALREKAEENIEKAYAHRDRLSDPERYLLLSTYYFPGKHADGAKARAALERLLELQPNNSFGLINLARVMEFYGRSTSAESLLKRALSIGPASQPHYFNLALAQAHLQKVDSADATANACVLALPKDVSCQVLRGYVLWIQRRYDSAGAVSSSALAHSERADQFRLALQRANLARLHGKIADATRLTSEAFETVREAGERDAALRNAISAATDAAWFFGDSLRAFQMLQDSLARYPIESVPIAWAPYDKLVTAYQLLGHLIQARRALAQFQARRIPASPIDSVRARLMEGQVALAARDYPKAQAALREADRMGTCTICNMPMLARAYDLEGNADSAIAVFERFVNVNILLRQEVDGLYLPAVHKRLGELYEAKGEREKALQHYRIFIDLWKDADPQLQPRVRDARQRVTALTRGTDVRR